MNTSCKYYAHSREGRPPAEWEPLDAHLNLTADGNDVLAGASRFAATFGAEKYGRILGLWHDLGKHSEAFQTYLRSGSRPNTEQNMPAGHVDHSTAGAQHAVRIYGAEPGRILAYCIAGHHAGLADWDDGGSRSCLKQRLAKMVESWRDRPQPGLLERIELSPPALQLGAGKRRQSFAVATFTRMLFSCLVDADYLATEAFLDHARTDKRGIDMLPNIEAMDRAYDGFMADLQRKAEPTDVNIKRREIFDTCLDAASTEPGVFSLTVPTGGGKTLASLGFALKHILHHRSEAGPRRIIYAIPYTSIIEQNADEFRKVFASLGDRVVLEHHSNFDPTGSTADVEEQETRDLADWNRLASENWDAPLVVTTNVQLFESLFAARPSRCRKQHNIVRSVIILDEVQTLPVDLLEPCLAMLQELVANYGCTIVLCSATQPAVAQRDGFRIGLHGVREIVPEPERLQQVLKRTKVEYVGELNDARLVDRLVGHKQVLCIVNTRDHAANLFQSLPAEDGRFHLSTRMCPEHRTKHLNRIRQRLKDALPCRVVSTQLIEAGVDIDFPAVYRAMSGIDSIAQAAGRCNREGRNALGPVTVFEPEVPTPRGTLRQTADAARELLPEFEDPLSLQAIQRYFELHYWKRQDRWDHKGIMDLFMVGSGGWQFQFRTAAELFRLIDQPTRPIIIPWGDKGQRLCDRITGHAPLDRETQRAAQRYTIPVHEYHWNRLTDAGGSGDVVVHHDSFAVLDNMNIYDEELGLRLDKAGERAPEDLIF